MPVPRALEPAGMVLADKPVGPSSFQIVRQWRDRTGARAGHAGTLDPLASGLLLVLLGAATRLAQYLVGLDKRYLTEIDLSARTSSGDAEGERIEEREPPGRAELENLLERFRGEVELRVPALSAIKLEGERAYRSARMGKKIEMPLRRSLIGDVILLEYARGVARLDLRVGSGTYVRALADALGGHCRTLRRLEVGPFSIENAGERLLSPAEAVFFLPSVKLNDEEVAAARSGKILQKAADGAVALLHEGNLIGVGQGLGATVRAQTVMPV